MTNILQIFYSFEKVLVAFISAAQYQEEIYASVRFFVFRSIQKFRLFMKFFVTRRVYFSLRRHFFSRIFRDFLSFRRGP